MKVVCLSSETYASLPVEKKELVRALALAGAEKVERPLARLVGRVAGDRERLEPALRDSTGGETAEDRGDDPHEDDRLAVTGGDMSEPSEHGSPLVDGDHRRHDGLRSGARQSAVGRLLDRRKSVI